MISEIAEECVATYCEQFAVPAVVSRRMTVSLPTHSHVTVCLRIAIYTTQVIKVSQLGFLECFLFKRSCKPDAAVNDITTNYLLLLRELSETTNDVVNDKMSSWEQFWDIPTSFNRRVRTARSGG